eukprot:2274398-Rhodomonas_salina.2
MSCFNSPQKVRGTLRWGWHDTTPSAWMYSVRLQLVMLVKDTVFDHDRDYPFLDPTSIIKQGTLTADQIN